MNIADVEFRAWGHNAGWPVGMNAREEYQARLGDLGRRMGAQKLGYNVTVVPPRKKAFPLHNHQANEEMFFILEGDGELRYGDTRHPLRAGDVIACPAGGPETAHQIINTGNTEMRYLSLSTMAPIEICEYPDSGKFGVYEDLPDDADGRRVRFRHLARHEDARDYWEGE
jgi:uncharacterized cupin superfamily protein